MLPMLAPRRPTDAASDGDAQGELYVTSGSTLYRIEEDLPGLCDEDDPPCVPGSVEESPCVTDATTCAVGTRTRTCDAQCSWQWTSCSNDAAACGCGDPAAPGNSGSFALAGARRLAAR